MAETFVLRLSQDVSELEAAVSSALCAYHDAQFERPLSGKARSTLETMLNCLHALPVEASRLRKLARDLEYMETSLQRILGPVVLRDASGLHQDTGPQNSFDNATSATNISTLDASEGSFASSQFPLLEPSPVDLVSSEPCVAQDDTVLPEHSTTPSRDVASEQVPLLPATALHVATPSPAPVEIDAPEATSTSTLQKTPQTETALTALKQSLQAAATVKPSESKALVPPTDAHITLATASREQVSTKEHIESATFKNEQPRSTQAPVSTQPFTAHQASTLIPFAFAIGTEAEAKQWPDGRRRTHGIWSSRQAPPLDENDFAMPYADGHIAPSIREQVMLILQLRGEAVSTVRETLPKVAIVPKYALQRRGLQTAGKPIAKGSGGSAVGHTSGQTSLPRTSGQARHQPTNLVPKATSVPNASARSASSKASVADAALDGLSVADSFGNKDQIEAVRALQAEFGNHGSRPSVKGGKRVHDRKKRAR